MNPTEALAFFLPGMPVEVVEPLGQGHINDTWRVRLADGLLVVLQRLHPGVFPDPGAVMTNMQVVTESLDKLSEPGIVFFRLVASPLGENHCIDAAGFCWRLLTYIDNSRTLTRLENSSQAEAIGGLLGRFHLLTAAIDPEILADPLPDFHVTPRYLEQYDTLCHQVRESDERETYCRALIETLRPMVTILEAAEDRLSRRVIHGDPKAANFLFAADADRAISLIDFDTVKPGLVLHDLGDCLRSCCNPLGEDLPDPVGAHFDPDWFQALMAGYVRQAGHLLTPQDRSLVVSAAALISFELGLRFFTDHLAGDRYFKISRSGHNLHRALVQFHLNRSIEVQRPDLEERLARLFV